MDDDTIDASLRFVREHLGMDIAYLSEFVDGHIVFRALDTEVALDVASVGSTLPQQETYCHHISEGRLPELINDTADHPLCSTIPATALLPIKSHISVPVLRADGTAYGMFCCLSHKARMDLNSRDVGVMRAFAAIAGEQVNNRLSHHDAESTVRNRTLDIMRNKAFDIVYQPIMDAQTRRPKGFESLARFRSEPYRTPDVWIGEARQVGLQQELEICLIETALKALSHLPKNIYVSVNASPETVASGELADVLMPWPAERVVLEITEHSLVSDYDTLLKELDALRFRGVRLAIDDAGAGYAGLQQIVQLHPDIIKLDVTLTADIDTSVVRRSLGAALVSFANEIGAGIVAEGIETGAELETLQGLGVPMAQGYFLGRPADLDTAIAWFDNDEGQARA
ncbi:MAG: EAL domain-containing protein [Pseudomonadota bacterium]